MLIFYFHKSKFEKIIDCFTMFSSPPPLPPGLLFSLSSDSRKIRPP